MTGTSSRTSALSILALVRSRETLLNPPCLGGTFCFWGFPKSPFLFAVELHSFLTTPVPSLLRRAPFSFLSLERETKQRERAKTVLSSGHVCPIFGITRRTRSASTASRISFLRLLRTLRLNEDSENRTDSKGPSCGNVFEKV